ncbi:diablo homolog, mitochondrial-like isoform X2 [Megalops cyprinoides]|uniref:diablo homolog, mitochondrial-like isoform X2 n=1 Tax=Megalops cyprinoides TaxID=118141 RepID=UPI001864A3DD|nr:diablo homolog, mitochondrial-like isoform X2 [Megalops cyprinoides]
MQGSYPYHILNRQDASISSLFDCGLFTCTDRLPTSPFQYGSVQEKRHVCCFKCFTCRCTSGVLSSSNITTRKRLSGLPTVIRKNWITLCTGGGLCAVPFSQQAEGLSHEALIRRASSLVTDSVNTFLSQTTLALVDSLTQYVKAAHTLMALQKRYVSVISKLSPEEEEAIWQVIIRQREEVSDRRQECRRFESSWMNAINLSEMAAETAYNAGADQASVTARTNLQVAQAHVEQVRQLSLEAERKLAETKAEEMERNTQFASKTVDEDIPEAYLRED